jgi:hypothetical protein
MVASGCAPSLDKLEGQELGDLGGGEMLIWQEAWINR